MKVFDPQQLGLVVSKINGFEAKLKCPFHHDSTPSATFNLVSGLFHCFGCGYSINAFQIAKEFGGEVVKIDHELINVKTEIHEWRPFLYSSLAYDNKYLKKRGVSDDQVKSFGILQSKQGIIFPIRGKSGEPIGIQIRQYKDEPRYLIYGDKVPVWPISNLRYDNLFLVEGVFGVLRLDLMGIRAVCVMGASSILPATKALQGHKVKIAFDDDDPGYLGAFTFMKFHKDSYAVVPGLETDELRGDSILRAKTTKNILQYAIDEHNQKLIQMIKKKEIYYETKRKNNKYLRS